MTTRETYRLRLHDLGHKDAVSVEKGEYDRLRATELEVARSPAGLVQA